MTCGVNSEKLQAQLLHEENLTLVILRARGDSKKPCGNVKK